MKKIKSYGLPAVEPSSSLLGVAMRFTEKVSYLRVLLQGFFVALGLTYNLSVVWNLSHRCTGVFFIWINSVSAFMSGLYICHPVEHRSLQSTLFLSALSAQESAYEPKSLLRIKKKVKKEKKVRKECSIQFLWNHPRPRAFGCTLPMLIRKGYLRFRYHLSLFLILI